MKNKKILFDIQNFEEYEEIKILSNSIFGDSYIPFFIASRIKRNNYPNDLINYTNYNFLFLYKLLPEVVVDFIRIFVVFFLVRPDLHFTGSPALSHRVFHFLTFYKFKHYIYYRGLLTPSSNSISRSDFFKNRIFKNKLNSFRIVNNFLCDFVFVSGSHNKNFLIKYGVPEKNIVINNSVMIERRKLISDNRAVLFDDGFYVFITTAYLYHNLISQHNDQLNFIRLFLEKSDDLSIGLILRIHPRDNFDYAEYFIKYLESGSLVLDRSSSENFIKSIGCNQKVISPLSTLAFELVFFGFEVVLYSSGSMSGFDKFYIENYGLVFYDDIEEIISGNCDSNISSNINKFYSESEF